MKKKKEWIEEMPREPRGSLCPGCKKESSFSFVCEVGKGALWRCTECGCYFTTTLKQTSSTSIVVEYRVLDKDEVLPYII